MSVVQKIIGTVMILALLGFLSAVIWGDKGIVDFQALKKEQVILMEKNNRLVEENLSLYREIDRLKHDLKYIESVARRELGMIGRDELILKIKQPSTAVKSNQPKKSKTGASKDIEN